MYRTESGSGHGLMDTAIFVDLLNRLVTHPTPDLRDLLALDRELIVTRAPGRLDLMGGIADYSGSLVLELPIAGATHVALQRRTDRSLRLLSLPTDSSARARSFQIALDDLVDDGEPLDYGAARALFPHSSEHHWAAYVVGAFVVLMREKAIRFDEGASILIGSSVPEGKGVSSSASLEVATLSAVAAAYGIDLAPRDIALLCQRVENLVAGAPCGVMDQMTSACGEADRLLALLCQPGQLRGSVTLPPDLAVWGLDSGIRHSVGGAEYGTVRAAAFMGYRMIAEVAGLPCRPTDVEGHVTIDDPRWRGYLANIEPDEFERSYAGSLPETITGAEFLERYGGITDRATSVDPRRSYPVKQATAHPVYENARVGRFARILDGWRPGRGEELGALMYESHASYSACGLGSSGTDALVGLVREIGPARGLYGAKITGGGSGGTVAVLGRDDARDAVDEVARRYEDATGRVPFLVEGSSPGAGAFGHLRLVPDDRREATS
jgi:galactokinase